MKVGYSKSFDKAVRKLSGKILESVKEAINEVKRAERIEDITDCKKLTNYHFVYRIRIGSHRAFFTFHIHIEGDTLMFEYLVARGEAYNKEIQQKLRKKDKEIE